MGIITNKIYICLPFEKEIDKIDWDGLSTEEYNGKTYYKIPSGGSSSDVVKKITFETLKDNVTVTLNIVSSSEQGCDFAYACYLDGNGGYNNYKQSISGDNKSVTLEYVVPTKGSHWIYIGYRKDSSINKYNDCGYFSIGNSTKEYVIRQPKEVYLASDKMNEITYGSKKILEHGFNNTISWETLRWNKSNNSYTYNTKDRLTFSYYLSSKRNYAYLYNSPNNIPNNGKIDWVKFNDINSYINNSYNFTYKLDLSDWDTSNMKRFDSMFNNCTGITYADVSGFNTSNVNYMNRMFNWCKSLKYLDVSKWDTSKVSNMEMLFRGCESLTYLDVSRFDTSNVINMHGMFYNCRSLTYLDVSKWDTSKLYDLTGTFEKAGRINMIDMSNWNLSNLGEIGNSIENLFLDSYCENIKLPNMNLNKPFNLNYGNAFKNLSYLKSFYAPELINSKTTKVDNLFYNNKELEYIDMHDWDFSNVTSAKYMFYGCYSLISLIDGHESDPNVSILNGLKNNISLENSTKLNYESVYALFRGVSTVTTTQTITLPKVMEGKLDATKVKIATDKGWTIAYK